MRAYNKKIVYFNEHLKRIMRSGKLIAIESPYAITKLKEVVKETIKINDFQDAYVRLTFWKKEAVTDVLIVVKKYTPYSTRQYKQGLRAGICPFRQNENSFFTQMKSTNYLFYRVSLMQAKSKGFDEAIILNNRGYIAEGSRSNIFLIKDNQIFTPALECGCLNGITRRAIFDLSKKYKIKLYEGKFIPSDLYTADEAFLTNSLIGVMPLTHLEKKPIAEGLMSSLTKFFMQKYNLLLNYGT